MAKGYWILAGGEVFSFDAVLIEQHAQEMMITREPLETGVVVADHAVVQPARLSLEVAVSDIALRTSDSDPFSSSTSRSAKALDALKKLQATAEPFTVVTEMQLCLSMQMVSISADQTAQVAGIYRLDLEEIRFVDTKTVTYPPRAKGKPARMAAPKTNGGQKDAPAVVQQTQVDSVLFSLGAKAGLITP